MKWRLLENFQKLKEKLKKSQSEMIKTTAVA